MNDILLKYNRPGPRYTSYPPATFFQTAYNAIDYKEALTASNQQYPESISIYIHIPFCPRQCHFCGCNTTIAQEDSVISSYKNAIINEIKNVASFLDKNRLVTQIHWGGGTPNSISFEYIGEIMQTLKSLFRISEMVEIAMECNPAYLEYNHIDTLVELGFNRISLGVQDFKSEVLNAINRLPSKYPLEDIFAYFRKKGNVSLNMDLVYGLPLQTKESFSDTIKKAITLSPDRLVTFSYAHVPWFNQAMKKLEDIGLPTTEQKFELFDIAYNLLSENGYIPIGLDHYAKPSDELAIAMNEKKLHRNFQGYCTRETTGQVYAFGASGISQLWSSYSQNVKNVKQYISAIQEKGFAVERGYNMTKNDLICREAINSIMCNGFIDFDELKTRFDIQVHEIKDILKYSPEKLNEFVDDELVEIAENKITVNRKGMLIVRNIAMAFDPQLEVKQGMYSKTI